MLSLSLSLSCSPTAEPSTASAEPARQELEAEASGRLRPPRDTEIDERGDERQPRRCVDGERHQGDGQCGDTTTCASGFSDIRHGDGTSGQCLPWQLSSPLPDPVHTLRFALGSGDADNLIYGLCGSNADSISAPRGVFANTDGAAITSEWISMPGTGTEGCAPIVIGANLYAFGGHVHTVDERAQPLRTAVASLVAPILSGLPIGFVPTAVEPQTARTGATAIVDDGFVYLFGGADLAGNTMVRTVERAPILEGDQLGAFEVVGELAGTFVQPNITLLRAGRFVVAAALPMNDQPMVEVFSPRGNGNGNGDRNRSTAPPSGLQGCQIIVDDHVIGLGFSSGGGRRSTSAMLAVQTIEQAPASQGGSLVEEPPWQRIGRLPWQGAPYGCSVVGGMVLVTGDYAQASTRLWVSSGATLMRSQEGW